MLRRIQPASLCGAAPRRRRRRLFCAALLALAAVILLHACASYHIGRARAARAAYGDRLYREDFGPNDAPATVFLPGMLGTTTYWKAAGAQGLASSTRRILLVDELGFGRSPWPDVAYTLDDHLAALERTLTAAGATRHLTLVGHSFGAILAAEYATRHLPGVDQVVLLGTPIYRDRAEALAGIGEMSALAGLTARHQWLARLICFLHNAAMPLATRLAPYVRRDLPPAVARDGALHYWPSVRGSVDHVILDHSVEPAIGRLGPILTFVHGRRDRITPLQRVSDVARASGAALVETDDDHLSYWRATVPVLRTILLSDRAIP